MVNMNVEELKAEVNLKFDVLCFYDLADVMTSHGEIFKIFNRHYCCEYQPDQRLVFYTSSNPSQLVLNHLQRAATKIDISNYFIIICSPHDITLKLSAANNKYGNDNVDIQYYFCSLDQTNVVNVDKIYPFDTFCPAPFGMLAVSSTNLVAPCCKYQEITGSFNLDSLHNEKIIQLRADIKNGQRHKNCKICWDVEDQGGHSLRQHFINKHMELCDRAWIDNVGLRDLTISPGNLCNFKCRICKPTASSSIAVEELKFSDDIERSQNLKIILKKYSGNNNQLTADKILQTSSLLTNLHILGGEPFLWQDLDYLLSNLIDIGVAKNIEIEFNTNGSKFPTDVVDNLLKFKSVEILISIDDIEQRFELQRGGTWSQVLKNIQSFNKLRSPTFKVKIAPTVNIQNLLYLDQLVNFCSSLDLEIVWWYLETPEFFSINNTTQTTKNLAYKKYAEHPNAELRAIANRVLQSAPVNGKLFLDYMKKLDQRRGQNSSTVLKEIFDAMSS